MDTSTLIFDFDGTLADVEPLFLDIYNRLASEFRFAPITAEEIPFLKTMGTKDFLRKKIHLPFWNIPRLIRRGHEEYRKSSESIELFPGIQAVISELKTRGYRIGILSSSKQAVISTILARFNVHVDFIRESSIFGKARSLEKTLREEKLERNSVIYIGDEIRDIEACRQAGIGIVAVTWGLNAKDTLAKTGVSTIDAPQELLSFFAPLKP